LASFHLHRKFEYQSHAVEEQLKIIALLSELSIDLKKIAVLLEANKAMSSSAGDRLIDRLAVEKLLGLSERTVRRLTREKKFKAKYFGKKAFYSEREILDMRDEFLS
jgi:DNA-binding transcriptional MerR regulator